MRLTFLTHTPESGGSTSLLMQLREFFCGRGHTTTVVVGADGPEPALSDYLVVPPARGRGWRARLGQYRETVQKTAPDVVYSISGKDEFDVLRFLRYPRVRQVSSLENNPYANIRFWIEQLSGFFEAITANTPDVLAQIRTFDADMKVGIVAPYRCAPEFLAVQPPQASATAPPKKTVDICYVGRLEPFLKRAHWLSPIIQRLDDLALPIHWHIYGKGPCEARLRRDLSAFESKGTVFFHGWRDKQFLARDLPGRDIFFLCSRSEGLPVAMVEGMLCGLACVVPAYPAGITYALEDGGGWLYEARSPEDCVAILREAVSHRNVLERKKSEAWRLAVSRFAGPVVAAQLNELEAGIRSLTFNGNCLDLDRAPRLRAVHPWVSARRRLMTALGLAPERF